MSLTDINSNYYFLFYAGSRWLSFGLDFMAAVMTLWVALFVVLSDKEIISPALKGLALSCTIQVHLTSKKIKVCFVFLKIHCKQLQRVCLQSVLLCHPADRLAAVCREDGNRG